MQSYEVYISDGEVKCFDPHFEVPRDITEEFLVRVLPPFGRDYKLEVVVDKDPADAIRVKEISNSMLALVDNNRRHKNKNGKDEIKFGIMLKPLYDDMDEPKALDPIIVND